MLYVDPTSHSFALRGAEAIGGPAREEAVLQEFEHLFVNQLLKEMRKTLPKGGVFRKSSQQQYFEEVFDDHLAGEIAKSGQFGIAAQMEEQLALAKEGLSSTASREQVGGLPLAPAAAGLTVQGAPSGIVLAGASSGLSLPDRFHCIPIDGVKVSADRADKQAEQDATGVFRRPRSAI